MVKSTDCQRPGNLQNVKDCQPQSTSSSSPFSLAHTRSSHPRLLSITAENPEISATKALPLPRWLAGGLGRVGEEGINWKIRKKSRAGEEISQENASGRNKHVQYETVPWFHKFRAKFCS